MDLLYLEYLRGRLADDSIREVVIVPWSGWRDDRNRLREERIEANLRAVFGAHFDRVTVVKAAMLQRHASSVFQNEFFEQVGNLGDSEFLQHASAVMGYRFRSYHDINQGHPESHQARSIVEHTVRGWLIAKYVEERLSGPDAPRRIGSLMWERELTKLLLLQNLLASHSQIECSLMLGSSVYYRHRGERRPIPTFDGSAICAFEDPAKTVEMIRSKSRSELRRTTQVLTDIVEGRAGILEMNSWSSTPLYAHGGAELRGDSLALARALSRVRAMYLGARPHAGLNEL